MFEESLKSPPDVINIKTNKWLFLLTLTLMSMAGLVGSDVYLPTLPAIGVALQRDPHAMQITLSIYLFGLAVGQLFLGFLTDRYGRKKIVIIGMLVYLIASLSCAFSINYYQLVFSRLIQSLGACSGLVIGRAIVGDLYSPKEASRVFSTIFPFVGMSPAISPVIGGFLGHYFGWQMNFYFVALFAFTIIALVHYTLPETMSPKKIQLLKFMLVFHTYIAILFNKKFLLYALAPCTAYIAYFAYIAQSPFIFYAHGFGEQQIGFFYVTLSLSYVAGNLVGKKMLKFIEIDSIIKWGYIIFNTGSFSLLSSGFFTNSLLIMIISISILTFGNGFLISFGTARVVSSFSTSGGYASGLLGFFQLGLAGLSSSLIGILSQNSIEKMGIYIVTVTLLGLFFNYILKYKI